MEEFAMSSGAQRPDVAPLISDAKASQAWRRFLSTVLGGGRILPGMTLKIYLFQALLWFFPVVISGALAISVDGWPYLRLILGAALNFSYGLSLELLRWAVARRGSAGHGTSHRRSAWFFDDEEVVDFRHLFSAQVMDLLLPRRSPLVAVQQCLASALLGALTAQLLVPEQLATVLQLDQTSAYVVSCWVFVTAGMAHFGLHLAPAPEVSLSSTDSRCFLVLTLLAPLLWDVPVELARLLLVTLALLPLLWAAGVLPSLAQLLLWSFEQVELHLFGGSSCFTLIFSVCSCGAIAWLGRSIAEGSFEYVLLAETCLGTSALLISLSPLDSGWLDKGRWMRVVGCWLQVLLAGGLVLPCIFAISSDWLLLIRVVLEQVALCLSLLAVYAIGHWQLKVWCCGQRNGHYLRHRKLRHWDEGERAGDDARAASLPVSEKVLEVTAAVTAASGGAAAPKPPRRLLRVARQIEVVEVLARTLLLVHISFYGVSDLRRGSDTLTVVPDFFLVALVLRQQRLAFNDFFRAALDASLAGLLVAASSSSSFSDSSLESGELELWQVFSAWPVAVQIFAVSVVRQRLMLLWALLRYVVHVLWITSRIPKLRHPVTPLLLWLNVLFWPGLLVVLLLCAAMEMPVMAIFSLPLFTFASPRWSRSAIGGAETAESAEPLVKGAEGLFYAIAFPSLLCGLALQWRAQVLSRAPGSLLFCRSHERLACVVRVLASGFGWVQLEMRGLELQEPTSCHHVEAGKIDEAFAHAFEGERAPERQSFVLQPVCEMACSTYEQSLISLRGLLDNPELLRQIHGLFLKSLVWVMTSLEEIPPGWLNCPMKQQDAKEVLQLLGECSWPPDVASALGISRPPPEASVATEPTATATATSGLRAAAKVDVPRPPPGTPPIIRPPQKAVGEAVPLPSAAAPAVTGMPSDGERSYESDATAEDLDSLMDQVLGMAPSQSRRALGPRDGPGPRGGGATRRDAAPARQAARRLLSDGASARHSGEGGEKTNEASEAAWAAVDRPQVKARSSFSTLTGSMTALGFNEDERTAPNISGPGGVANAVAVAERVAEPAREEPSPLASLVTEAYVAVNVAPLFGQKPEAHGTAHVLRLFSGQMAVSSQETAELKWLVERPELFQLTLRAFRFAVKISIDAAAMGEEVEMEYQAFKDLAEDLQQRWFLGMEGSLLWEAAMKRRWPNLMALRPGKGVGEVQVLRLRYCQDLCRVAELRVGVWSSIWASAALELRYFANDDDERYSIQAHPTLFRNMAVQCAEYPIFVSKVTLWL